MFAPNQIRLILLPGIGADGRLFDGLRETFPQLEVPQYISPRRREPLAEYAARFAATIAPNAPGDERPIYLGGSSFGGIVAQELCRHLKPRALFLLGSCSSYRGVALRWRLLYRFRMFIPTFMFKLGVALTPRSMRVMGARNRAQRKLLLKMFRETDIVLLHWGVRATMSWDGARMVDCPIYHIHGSKDKIMPMHRARPDEPLRGAGHAITLTHPEPVSQFIATHLFGRTGAPGANELAATEPHLRLLKFPEAEKSRPIKWKNDRAGG